MIGVEGTGALSHFSVRNTPDVFREPIVFAAVKVLGRDTTARVLEGPVPGWKIFGRAGTAVGSYGRSYGYPRFGAAQFEARFPFANIDLTQESFPLKCDVSAWSPFIPGNADDSSLPLVVLEYTFQNQDQKSLESVFSFHAENLLSLCAQSDSVSVGKGGFILRQTAVEGKPWEQGDFSVSILDPGVSADAAWFRGDFFDTPTMLWKNIESGKAVSKQPFTEGKQSVGGSAYVPFSLKPGEKRTVTVLLTWYVPKTNLQTGQVSQGAAWCGTQESREQTGTHVPWYAGRFANIEEVTEYTGKNLARLRAESVWFRDCLFDTSLPPEVMDAVAANLSILKSPTILRQTDGRLWGWEGCGDSRGSCDGSCTHVYNYAQAIPHLFPELERSLRQTEFNECQNAEGHQVFRAPLPIRPAALHDSHAAADGQLGGIMKMYREWRILGDNDWLRSFWPKITASLNYCINTWDPDGEGVLREPHHNTYDIEFWGPDGMCTSVYLGALKAASLMAVALGESDARYETLYAKGRAYMETKLFNGEYFIQEIQWKGLRAGDPTEAKAHFKINWSPEALALVSAEGPKYQYGMGCLSDGVFGAWLAAVCGVGEILDPEKVRSHLLSVYRYNLRRDLSSHVNPQRSSYAVGQDGGLLLCTWPKGGALSLPFIFSNEVWTGIEYQVASHMILMGCVEEGLEIVRIVRERYDGRVRNPFDEYECGHWYSRALASYGLLQGLTGIRYDAAEKTLYIEPRIKGDFRSFLCTATGYGTAGIRNGKPFVEIRHGAIQIVRTVYTPFGSTPTVE